MANTRNARPNEALSYDPELGPDYFIQIPQTILKDTKLSNGAFRLYCILLSYCRQRPTAWPGQDTLASDLGVKSVRQVQNLLSELRFIGLIDWQQNGQASNRYHVFKAPLKQRASADTKNISPADTKNISPLDTKLISPESHSYEQHEVEQHQPKSGIVVDIIDNLTGQGFNPRTAERLAKVMERNNQDLTFLQKWLAYLETDPTIKRPLGFLRVMIEENQRAPISDSDRQETAAKLKMAKWQKLAGIKDKE